MEFKYKINSRLLLLLMIGAGMTGASYLMLVYQPIHVIIKKVATLGPSTILLKLWEDPPYTVLIDVFIFNVTNSQEFLSNKEKMKVEQIGPYVYQETLLNQNPIFNDNGTMTYTPRRFLEFRRDLSVGDPDKDIIISPNIALIGIQSYLQNASYVKNIGFKVITDFFGSKEFVSITVTGYLFGYDDPLIAVAHRFLPNWIDFNRLGIFDRLMAVDNARNIVTLNLHPELNNTSPDVSKEEKSKVYHIHRWNGSPGLKQWGYINNATNNSKCSMVEGAFEGSVFPPNMQNETVRVYRKAFCRTVPFKYKRDTIASNGLQGAEFEIDEKFLATVEENPENSCYCLDGKCPPKGVGFIAPCYYDIPVTLSQPHFLNSEQWLIDQVEGMRPNATQHGSRFIMQRELGAPLDAMLRIQINLDVGKTKHNHKTEHFNGMVLPLFWLQLRTGKVPPGVTILVVLLTSVLPVLEQVLIYLMGLGGFALMSAASLYYLFFDRVEAGGRLSFRKGYHPVPVISMNSPYFNGEIMISK